jgi:hypothetical protein
VKCWQDREHSMSSRRGKMHKNTTLEQVRQPAREHSAFDNLTISPLVNKLSVRLKVLTEVTMKMTEFWDITPCAVVQVDSRFSVAYCLRHQGGECWWRQYVPLKRRSASTKTTRCLSQKVIIYKKLSAMCGIRRYINHLIYVFFFQDLRPKLWLKCFLSLSCVVHVPTISQPSTAQCFCPHITSCLVGPILSSADCFRSPWISSKPRDIWTQTCLDENIRRTELSVWIWVGILATRPPSVARRFTVAVDKVISITVSATGQLCSSSCAHSYIQLGDEELASGDWREGRYYSPCNLPPTWLCDTYHGTVLVIHKP